MLNKTVFILRVIKVKKVCKYFCNIKKRCIFALNLKTKTMENSIELLETNNFTLNYDSTAQRNLEHEFDFLVNGKKISITADVYVEYIEQEWYADEFGSATELELESLSVDIISSYDFENDEYDVLSKSEINQIEEYLNVELKKY